jgi:hypothetical protein
LLAKMVALVSPLAMRFIRHPSTNSFFMTWTWSMRATNSGSLIHRRRVDGDTLASRYAWGLLKFELTQAWTNRCLRTSSPCPARSASTRRSGFSSTSAWLMESHRGLRAAGSRPWT